MSVCSLGFLCVRPGVVRFSFLRTVIDRLKSKRRFVDSVVDTAAKNEQHIIVTVSFMSIVLYLLYSIYLGNIVEAATQPNILSGVEGE